MTTLIINIDKESSLKPLLELVKKLHLKAKIMSIDKKKTDEEHEDWMMLSAQSFAHAYTQDEPDINHLVLKEPNPEYNPD